MLHPKLIHPTSIVVVGGSDHIDHIGGSVLKNLIDQPFGGTLYVVNPKKDRVQVFKSYRDISLLPQTDLAIIAIPATGIEPVVRELTKNKGTRGFIIYSAGFAELDKKGAAIEKKIASIITEAGGSLLGPNNIGMINEHFAGLFTRPLPTIHKNGVDFISASGATAAFTIEAAQQLGLRFANIFTVGNSAQIGVEEILEHLDENFIPGESSRVKVLYIEGIKSPDKLLKHCHSLGQKGCSVIALKSGVTEKGNVAAASHTGAMVNSDLFVQALFKKAGIIRCHSRYELMNLAAILQITSKKLKRIAIITHAGGPGIILTDILTQHGLLVPDPSEADQNALRQMLFPGASTSNPIDMLATGTAEQLEEVLTYCEQNIDEVDGMVVIFGSPGLSNVTAPYEVIHKMSRRCQKPIFPILPSVVNVRKEIDMFTQKHNLAFNDEYLFGQCLSQVMLNKIPPQVNNAVKSDKKDTIRRLINGYSKGFLNPGQVYELLQAAGIPMARQILVKNETELMEAAESLDFPLAQKVVGPLHKSDKNGVILNVSGRAELIGNFRKMIKMADVDAVMIQEMILGKEVYIGAKREAGFPPLILCGAGGIYIEVLKDHQYYLSPLSREEARKMVEKLRINPVLKGMRGEASCHMEAFYDAIVNISNLMEIAPEVSVLDINPLKLNEQSITAVDARVKID